MERVMWIEGPDIPKHLEGRQAWRWVAGRGSDERCAVLDAIPRDFSRDPHHCGGVFFWPVDVPKPPTICAVCGTNKFTRGETRLEGGRWACSATCARRFNNA